MGMTPLYYAKNGGSVLTIIERGNDHSLITKFDLKMPYPLLNRQLITQILWEKTGEGEYFFSQTTCTHPACATPRDTVRMDLTRTMKLKQISPSLTSILAIGNVHLCGNFPPSINKAITIPQTLAGPPNLMLYFAAVRPEDEFDDGDSAELGQLAFYKLYPHHKHNDTLRKEINELISLVSVFRACQAKYGFLDEFLFHIMKNKTKIGAAQTGFNAKTPLAALTTDKAGLIAISFPRLLMTNVNGEGAVDEFVLTFPALGDLDHEYSWFRPAMVAMANDLMSKVAYGVKVRAGIGGSISMLDMASDATIIVEYILTGRDNFAYILIGMVAANILFQLLIVWVQTQGLTENRWRRMLVEMLATVLFIKPGLDSWRVASGAEQLPGSAETPLMEMAYSKSGEMVFEAVPGMVLQFSAILTAKRRSNRALVSLLISAASAGLTATSLFFDVDVDPGVRKRNPVWSGAVPDQGRGQTFAVIFMLCTLHVMAKGAATALMYIAKPRFLMIYIAVDYGLYFMYCAARKDVVFFTAMPPTASKIISPLARIIMKVLGDFSGSPVARLPILLGGSYYMLNLITAQASVLVAVFVYNLEMAGVVDKEKVPADTLWIMAISSVAVWCVAVSFFLVRFTKRSHRHTFWSTVSGRQCVQEYFTKGSTDEGKLSIFENNMLLWESDIGSNVMEFTLHNWARWERDKPAWFTPHIKAMVPDEYMPREFLAGLGGAHRLRRGSAAGSVRESFRMIESAGNVGEYVVAEEVTQEVIEFGRRGGDGGDGVTDG
jgi:hypothetical protein